MDGGVTAAKGFLAAGVYVGIKKKKKDMALVYSEVPANVAGTFTTNVVKAAPVLWDQSVIAKNETVRAMVLNSGVANACTGALGDNHNARMAGAVAHALNIKDTEVLTASTGVIGVQLPIDTIELGVPKLVKALGRECGAGADAAEAIMTTDTYKKECCVQVTIDGCTVTVGGMAKGSGMIHPNMATMLGVITTDVAISKAMLQQAVREVVADTFNMISVDRDTSTNDSFVCLSNGLSGNEEITTNDTAYHVFYEALHEVAMKLSKSMAADGEGATKLLEVTVVGAKTKEDAKQLSKSVISSNLVKTAIFGTDANWGRILCAMGYSGVIFDPYQVDITLVGSNESLLLVQNGLATGYLETKATQLLSQRQVTLMVDIKMGEMSATAWGCDLTYDYIKINGDYRS